MLASAYFESDPSPRSLYRMASRNKISFLRMAFSSFRHLNHSGTRLSSIPNNRPIRVSWIDEICDREICVRRTRSSLHSTGPRRRPRAHLGVLPFRLTPERPVPMDAQSKMWKKSQSTDASSRQIHTETELKQGEWDHQWNALRLFHVEYRPY